MQNKEHINEEEQVHNLKQIHHKEEMDNEEPEENNEEIHHLENDEPSAPQEQNHLTDDSEEINNSESKSKEEKNNYSDIVNKIIDIHKNKTECREQDSIKSNTFVNGNMTVNMFEGNDNPEIINENIVNENSYNNVTRIERNTGSNNVIIGTKKVNKEKEKMVIKNNQQGNWEQKEIEVKANSCNQVDQQKQIEKAKQMEQTEQVEQTKEVKNTLENNNMEGEAQFDFGDSRKSNQNNQKNNSNLKNRLKTDNSKIDINKHFHYEHIKNFPVDLEHEEGIELPMPKENQEVVQIKKPEKSIKPVIDKIKPIIKSEHKPVLSVKPKSVEEETKEIPPIKMKKSVLKGSIKKAQNIQKSEPNEGEVSNQDEDNGVITPTETPTETPIETPTDIPNETPTVVPSNNHHNKPHYHPNSSQITNTFGKDFNKKINININLPTIVSNSTDSDSENHAVTKNHVTVYNHYFVNDKSLTMNRPENPNVFNIYDAKDKDGNNETMFDKNFEDFKNAKFISDKNFKEYNKTINIERNGMFVFDRTNGKFELPNSQINTVKQDLEFLKENPVLMKRKNLLLKSSI